MKTLKLHFFCNNQKGFTLIELLVAVAITAVIGSVLTMSIFQLFSINAADKNRMEAVKQVENALHYINRDAQTAYSAVPTDADFPLVLTWREWDETDNSLTGPEHQVTYYISNNQLLREEIIDSGSPSERVIAVNISDDSACTYDNDSRVLTVNIIASVGGYKPAVESRTLRVQSRPAQPEE